jgi:UV DNA damage endonuclease
MTHPDVGYAFDHLPDSDEIQSLLETCRIFAKNKQVRLSFHPDQFVVPSSPHPSVVANSLRELEYHAQLAKAVGADVINIHAGGAYGDKQAALHRFGGVYDSLSERVRSRIALENDDSSYTPEDLLPVCEKRSIPLVYDVHHHRCNPDHLTVEAATEWAETTWKAIGREQYCHLSSPRSG